MSKGTVTLLVIAFVICISCGAGYVAYRIVREKLRRFSRAAFGTDSIAEGFEQQAKELAVTPKSVSAMTRIFLPQMPAFLNIRSKRASRKNFQRRLKTGSVKMRQRLLQSIMNRYRSIRQRSLIMRKSRALVSLRFRVRQDICIIVKKREKF